MSHFNRSGRENKPTKPYPDFPLFAHGNGSWAKRINGRVYYFGPWKDPDAALNLYLETKDDLFAGRKPRPKAAVVGCTMADLGNEFLNFKRHRKEAGELTARMFDDYESVAVRLVKFFGPTRLVEDLRPEDFEELRHQLAKKWGPVTLLNFITRCRGIFKFAHDNGLIPHPVRYGQGFKLPSQKQLRRARNQKGPRMFEARELVKILALASQPLESMILLGINCGFGNSDCGNLPLKALDLNRGWLDFPRPKTEVTRRCPLWPETIEALQEWMAHRPKARAGWDLDAAGLVFVTKYGKKWAKLDKDNPISKEMAKLLKELGLHRPGLNFYALRHTFETIAGETDRQAAVDFLMGHAPRSDDMSAVYRQRISDDRLRAVTDHVRGWLFGRPAGPAGE
jgi:integrase